MPSPDAQIQNFIASTLLSARMKGVSDIHPVTLLKSWAGVDHLVVISFEEPYYTAAPIGVIWINPDQSSALFGRVFRLVGTSFYLDPLLALPTLTLGSDQLWVEIFEFDSLFMPQVYVDSTLDMQVGVTGPRGPLGPQGATGQPGLTGLRGPTGSNGARLVIDDDAIAQICTDVLSTVFQELPTLSDMMEVRYGTSNLDVVAWSDADLAQFTKSLAVLSTASKADSVRFSLTQNADEYGYLVIPESRVPPVDNLFVHADTGIPGGWDGAKPDETLPGTRIFESYLDHAALSPSMCMYRTDNSGIGENNWILRLR